MRYILCDAGILIKNIKWSEVGDWKLDIDGSEQNSVTSLTLSTGVTAFCTNQSIYECFIYMRWLKVNYLAYYELNKYAHFIVIKDIKNKYHKAVDVLFMNTYLH